MIKFREEIEKIINNPTKADIIKKGHDIRMQLLKAIEQCNKESYQKIEKVFMDYIEQDAFDLMKRVKDNQLIIK